MVHARITREVEVQLIRRIVLHLMQKGRIFCSVENFGLGRLATKGAYGVRDAENDWN